MALLRFKQAYRGRRAASSTTSELPDHLRGRAGVRRHRRPRRPARRCCWTTGPGSSCCGWPCTTPARRGRDVLRGGLRDAAAAARRRARRRARLAAEGPPEEEVGLAPFAAAGVHAASRPRARSPARCRRRRPEEPSTAGRPPLGRPALHRASPSSSSATIWRYRYDKFGWTTRSSQLYENRLLRLGSPLFHFGILGVARRPRDRPAASRSPGPTRSGSARRPTTSWRSALGGRRRRSAPSSGSAILIYRRRTVGPVFSATTRNDKMMYVVLAAVDRARPRQHRRSATSDRRHYDYRESVSLWFRGDLHASSRDPDADGRRRRRVPAARAGRRCALFALWPFTRLVHVFSAPLGYLTRPYIVYRSRDRARRKPGTATWLGDAAVAPWPAHPEHGSRPDPLRWPGCRDLTSSSPRAVADG